MDNCIPAGLQLLSVTLTLDGLGTVNVALLFEKGYLVNNVFDHDQMDKALDITRTFSRHVGKRIVFWENDKDFRGSSYCFADGSSGAFGDESFVNIAIEASSKE